MDWCEDNSVTYVFSLTGTKALAAKVEPIADHIRVVRALDDKDAVRGFAKTTHAAKSWRQQRRVAARIEATRLGLDIRYVVTNIATGTPEWLYAGLYCARGQAENLIKLHKGQLASDRTSCRHPAANQMRLVLHTAAYWLMLTVRDAIPTAHRLARAEFATIRLRAAQARRSDPRDRCPRPPRLRRGKSRGRPATPPCDHSRPSTGLNDGAAKPRRTRSYLSSTDATFRFHTRHSGRAIQRAVSQKHVVSQAPVNKTG